MTKHEKKAMEDKFGKEEAKKIIAMQKKCDKFLLKFKTDMNEILKPHNMEVLCGVAYQDIEQKQEE